ncbi:MAG: hypothetical protein Q9220_005361 [cf. Caloplaca sp. 1 TL-2023]
MKPSADPAASIAANPQRIFSLGIHDGTSANLGALLHESIFADGSFLPGSLVAIAVTRSGSEFAHRESHDDAKNAQVQGSPEQAPSSGTRKHLFIAQPMNPDIMAKNPSVQISICSDQATAYGFKAHSQVTVSPVDRENYHASHVEIAFRDEYLSRSDMWRLVVSELAGKVVHKGQRLAFMGTIKVSIKTIYRHGQRAKSALFAASTKPIFRSESARYVLYVQMSKEMWDFDTVGAGEIMFDKVVNGFLPELFKRWQKVNARHLVTIILFTRLESHKSRPQTTTPLESPTVEPVSRNGLSFQDFYRVVVSDMPSGEWSEILAQLKKEYKVFLRDVAIQPNALENTYPDNGTLQSSEYQSSHVINGQPSPALRGNILEAVNLASSQFSCDYIDRDLVRTGVSVIVITPSTGLFEVDYNLLATTTDNLIENGVGIDLVCLSRLPLHSVPLFKYKLSQTARSPHSERSPDQAQQTVKTRLPGQGDDMQHQLSPRFFQSTQISTSSNSQRLPASDWAYGIPHWVDVSFWTSSPEEDRIASVLAGRSRRASIMRDRTARKPFVPRARMYKLQMMGVTESSMDQARLPLLLKPKPNRIHSPVTSGSFSHSLSPNSRSLHYRRSRARPLAYSKITTSSGSIMSQSQESIAQRMSQFRWMDDYDSLLYCDPKAPAESQPISRQYQRDKALERKTGGTGTSPATSNNSLTTMRKKAELRDSAPAQSQRSTTNMRAGERSNSPRVAITPSKTSIPKAPKLSRRISLGFRGFGAGTSKATASTELSVEHVQAAAATRRQEPASQSRAARTRLVVSTAHVQEDTDSLSASELFEIDEHLSPPTADRLQPTRPIAIRNPTELRISSHPEKISSQVQHNITRLKLQDSDKFVVEADPGPFLSQEATPNGEIRRQANSIFCPWLTVINPSNPNQADSDATSRLGRWQHIFPRKLKASKVKWKSLCSPAAVPLTTEAFPSASEIAMNYESSEYRVDLPIDDSLLEHPRSIDWLIKEMMAFRFSQGFQVVIGSRLMDALPLPNAEKFDIFNDQTLAQINTTIVMTRGTMIHKISLMESGQVEVQCLVRRSVAPDAGVGDSASAETYQPMIRTMLAEGYAPQSIAIACKQLRPVWNLIDSHIAGHQKQDVNQKNDDLRSWRARLVLIPVTPSSSARRPHLVLNEDNEEELRIEGIRKLTQIWQRFRHVPPSERRFPTSVSKRKDPNPLDIIYQTRNPSAIIAALRDNLGEEVSMGKPVELLPESELYQRSNFNLQALAQTIQGDKGVRMMDRRWHWRLHYNCFIGNEFTSWLLQNFQDVDTREEAVELGNELMQNGLFSHVEQRHNFRDGNYFYHVAAEYRSARPESKSTWFGSRKSDRSVPSTPISEGPGHESPKAPGSRASSTEEHASNETLLPNKNRQQLGVALSKSLLYDVDHRKRSYRPELITLHFDRFHNPDNCYHIRIDWMNVTSKLIEDAIVSWATSVDRFGLKLVEVPLAEASAITSMHPFRAPALVKLAKSPPQEQPQTYFDATSFVPQAKTEKHFYQNAMMKKFDFVLDFEAASAFPADVDVTYSWGKPDYKCPQYVHRSGTLLAQITDEGDFLLLANRLYNNRSSAAASENSSRPEDTPGGTEKAGVQRSSGPARGRSYRAASSPLISPQPSPVIPAAVEFTSSPSGPPPLPKPSISTFAVPEHIKKDFEAFCSDVVGLDNFYSDVLSKGSTPASATPKVSTPLMESSIPALGLPPSMLSRERSPAAEIGRMRTRIVGGGESPRLAAKTEDGR